MGDTNDFKVVIRAKMDELALQTGVNDHLLELVNDYSMFHNQSIIQAAREIFGNYIVDAAIKEFEEQENEKIKKIGVYQEGIPGIK